MSTSAHTDQRAESSRKLRPDQCERLFAHGLHEENVFYNRLNFFMVCESLLFAGAVSGLIVEEKSTWSLIIFICVLGVFVSLLWWFAQVNKLVLLKILEDRLMDTFPEIRVSIEAANRKRRLHVWSASAILAHALPAVFLLAWLYLLCHVLWIAT
jgi:hypothetical protein